MKKKVSPISRRQFIKTASLAALGTTVASNLGHIESVEAATKAVIKNDQGGPYNVLMIVTDQEQHLKAEDLPPGYRLPGHERLAELGVTFQNHQIASCVCTPSRAVIYTGQHIQNNGM